MEMEKAQVYEVIEFLQKVGFVIEQLSHVEEEIKPLLPLSKKALKLAREIQNELNEESLNDFNYVGSRHHY